MRANDIGALVALSDPRLSPDGCSVAHTAQSIELAANETLTNIVVTKCTERVDRTEHDTGATRLHLNPGTHNASMPRWSPDGESIACVMQERNNDDAPSVIARFNVTTRGYDIVCTAPSAPTELEWSPNGNLLAFVARVPDPEYYAAPGESRKAKDTPARKIERFFTRLDGEGWIFDQPSQLFVVRPTVAAVPRAITTGPHDVAEFSWSPDGTKLVCCSSQHANWDFDLLRDLWIIDLDLDADTDADATPVAALPTSAAQPTIHQLTETTASYSSPAWSADGATIAALRYATPLDGPCHNHVVTIDIATRSVIEHTTGLDRNCEVAVGGRALQWDNDGVAFLYQDAGGVALAHLEITTGSITPVLSGTRCVTGFDRRGTHLATTQQTSESLDEVFVDNMQITDTTDQFRRATGSIPAVPERFSATSHDGTLVECWVLRPAGDGPFPTLLNIHGGPFTQYGYRFFDEFQMQVDAGFAVVYCNPRGSSGYSEAWGRAIRWPECTVDPGTGWGNADYEDVMACIDTAIDNFDWIDGDRLGVLGGSYGGYLTTWIVSHNDRFRAACSERSVNNLITEEHNSDIATSFREAVGHYHLDAEAAYRRQSPIGYVRSINTPLLILHSEDDLRCPINQAEELFVALRLLGKSPEFWRFPGECHELSRSGAPKHRVQRAEIILDFFTRHLAQRAPF